jgi:hypothetical protein
MNIFEQISREATRFELTETSVKGVVSGEDLWNLSKDDLNILAKGYNKQLKALDEEDFIVKKSTKSSEISLKFEVVKHVLYAKVAEDDKKKLAKEKAQKRAELRELIGKKIRSAQEEKSIDELQEELEALDKESEY